MLDSDYSAQLSRFTQILLSVLEYNTENSRIEILPLMGPGEEKPGPRTHFHVEHEDRTIYPPLPKRMPLETCARCD